LNKSINLYQNKKVHKVHTLSTHPCGAHKGWIWAGEWAPFGLPRWGPANFVRGFHGGPMWAGPYGLKVGFTWALAKTHMGNPGFSHLGPTLAGPHVG